ncbi:MAG TPA: hypothetical protein VHV57_03255 [Acidimicrobiales bacterium]|jgi:hypothetical protein|nr:hypothetical protein [Acidimicrobiales bacterium]
MKQRIRDALKAFGHFWVDFLIGDTPEFALATLVIIGLALLLRHHRLAATIVLPGLTAAFLLASAYRGRRRSAD